MIKVWYEEHGQLPSKTEIIAADANTATTLPSPFSVEGVVYGRETGTGSDGEPIIDGRQFALKVEPPSDEISQDAVDSIAQAFADNWGGTIDHIKTVQA